METHYEVVRQPKSHGRFHREGHPSAIAHIELEQDSFEPAPNVQQ